MLCEVSCWESHKAQWLPSPAACQDGLGMFYWTSKQFPNPTPGAADSGWQAKTK